MASARSFRLTPLADADMDGIWWYSFEHWSAEQADTSIGAIVDAFSDLVAGRSRGMLESLKAGYLRLLVGSHIVYYREHASHIEVIRVLNQSMDVRRQL